MLVLVAKIKLNFYFFKNAIVIDFQVPIIANLEIKLTSL